MTDTLRDEEREILQFLSRASEERDDHISEEEIQRTLQIRSGDRVRLAITLLQRQGYIRRNPRFPIGFEILRRVDGSIPVRRSLAAPPRGSRSQPSQARAGLASAPPDVAALPTRQRQAYQYIQRCIQDRQLPPTVDELKDELGLLSRKFANDILVALDRKGFIRLGDSPKGLDRPSRRKSRTIELVHLSGSVREPTVPVPGEPSTVFVPVMGDVAAGLPVPNDTGELHWDEVARDWMELPREVLGRHDPANVFLMKVDGDSMIEDGVLPGDTVLVLHHAEGADGDLVVARFTNDITGTREATVKRYRRQNGHPWLLPANSAYAPIDAERAEIVGRVIALLRFPL